jgi:hypothetical protein
MKAKTLSIVAALALLGGAAPANAYLQFVYSENGVTVLTVTPWTAFGSASVYFPYPGYTNIYADHVTLTISSGLAGFVDAYQANYTLSPPPPVPFTQAFIYITDDINIFDQISDPSIPATITTPFVINSPSDFMYPIEVDSSWWGPIVWFDGNGEPTYDKISSAGAYYIQADELTISNVPEPSTWAMLALGFADLGYAGHRRAKVA